jgi:hypothetical protein
VRRRVDAVRRRLQLQRFQSPALCLTDAILMSLKCDSHSSAQ